MSSRRAKIALAALAGTALMAALPALGQYPGQIDTKAKKAPVLRAVAVLEWTGEAGKPKFSRIIPVCVFDGQNLQDAGVYLARPQPLAVDGGVEYVLEKDGKRVGLYDIDSAGQQEGAWVGFGAWKPMPKPKPEESAPELAQARIDVQDGSGGPVLHRRKGAEDSDGAGAKTPAPAPDPDRPRLHRPAPDTDRPTLGRARRKQANEVASVESVRSSIDPNRPRLIRGKPKDTEAPEIPALKGLPPEMAQMVAVSDAAHHPTHLWAYHWADPADEQKLKAEMEDVARKALGLAAPEPVEKKAVKRSRRRAKKEPSPPPPAPAPLEDEHFRVFQLTYTSGATMVLTARTGGALEDEKFVTLIAQPDLYGNLMVLFKSVTDGKHLDVTPQMRLVDAVDAMADNRGLLLFELRGRTQRQFALYRVMHGTVEQIFATGHSYLGVMESQ